MMKKRLIATALAATLCLGGAAQAAVLNFDDPGVIDIDNNTGVATYTESGFTISGPAASFLTLDGTLVGGIFGGSTGFSLRTAGGEPLALLSLNYGFYDLGFGAPPGVLTIVGLGGPQPVSVNLPLSATGSFSFGAGWSGLTSVTFNGTSGFFLDNVNAVPEPSTVVLGALGALGLGVVLRRRRVVV